MIHPVKFLSRGPLPIFVVVHSLENFGELSFADVSHYILVYALKVAYSQKVFHFGSNLQKICQVSTVYAQDSGLAHFCDLSQSEKNSEIKPPLHQKL